MRRPQLVGTVVVLGAALGGVAPAVDAAPRGKVVRIERGRPHVTAPAICAVNGMTATCFFNPPQPGDALDLFSDDRVIGQATVSTVSDGERCELPMWTVELRETATGDVPIRYAIRDRGINRAVAHTINGADLEQLPDGISKEHIQLALDRDGDGRADLEVALYTCDSTGAAADPALSLGSLADCLDLFIDNGAGLRVANHLIASSCK